jgi:hypothetical protein
MLGTFRPAIKYNNKLGRRKLILQCVLKDVAKCNDVTRQRSTGNRFQLTDAASMGAINK